MTASGAGRWARPVAGTTWPRLALFVGLAAGVLIADQLSKAWVDQSFALSRASDSAAAPLAPPTPVLGDFVRIAKGYNNGAIFSLFGSSATFFAVASLAAIAVIVWFAVVRGGRAPLLVTPALGLLLGGALGNLVDRIRLGYVIDFVDIGIGTVRWYTFNVADASISVAIVILLAVGLVGDRLVGDRLGGAVVSDGLDVGAAHGNGAPGGAADPAGTRSPGDGRLD